MSDKLITFCIPSYNSEEYLHYALDSLMGYPDIEVLIIDDGSHDHTLDVAEEYQKKDPAVFRAIHQENKGHGGAINNAVQQAKGIYFKVLDSDDWVDKDAMDALMEYLRKGEDQADLIVMDYVYQQGRDNPTQTISYSLYFPKNKTIPLENMHNHMKLKDNITLHSSIYKLSVIKESGVVLPEHCSYEDNYFVYAPMVYAKTVRYIPMGLYQYLIGREGQSMAHETCVRKYHDYVRCGYLIFNFVDLMKFKKTEKKRYRLLRHHFLLSMMMVPVFTNLNGSEQATKECKDFMAHCKQSNPAQYKMMRQDARVTWPDHHNKLGRGFLRFLYYIAHFVVRFN